MSIKNVVFDFDMTLGYRVTMWTDTVKELLLENNVYSTSEQLRPITHGAVYPWNAVEISHAQFFGGKSWWDAVSGKIADGLVERGVCEKGVALSVAKALPSRFCDLSQWKLFPDTIDTLTELKRSGYNLRLLSNHVPEARSIFTHLGLAPFFEKMTISSEEDYEKPDPRLWDVAAAGLDVKQTVMVGDNYSADVLGALGYGLHAVLVRKPNDYGYAYYAKTLREVPAIIGAID